MRKVILSLMVVGMILTLAAFAWAEQGEQEQSQHYDHSYGEMGPGGAYDMGGYGMMGPGMMGHRGMMDYGGRSMWWPYMMHHGWGMGPIPRGWSQMSPEQRKEWTQMRRKFSKDTLLLRKQIVNKRMELRDLWEDENPDTDKVRALSGEIADLQAKLIKQRNEFLLQCREKFGDRGWSCPSGEY
jgi:Spy/CpxP family protein refolding chaperone